MDVTSLKSCMHTLYACKLWEKKKQTYAFK
jgi:hypothetical protein